MIRRRGEKVVFVGLYVDDCICVGHGEEIEAVVQELQEKGFNLKIDEDLKDYLSNDKGKADVEQEMATGRGKYGIKGVPFFVVSGTDGSQRPYGFSGAQASDTFLELFQELAEQN